MKDFEIVEVSWFEALKILIPFFLVVGFGIVVMCYATFLLGL